jgi:hypothetical protein
MSGRVGVLAPMLALVLWSLIMWVALYWTRLRAMRRLGVRPEQGRLAGGLDGALPAATRQVADNYNHLMEQPTVFYAVCVLLVLAGAGTQPMNVTLAWSYVALRVVHSIVQSTVNHVPTRFAVFVVSTVALGGLAIQGIRALA